MEVSHKTLRESIYTVTLASFSALPQQMKQKKKKKKEPPCKTLENNESKAYSFYVRRQDTTRKFGPKDVTILIEEGFNAITESNSKSKEDLKEKLGIYTMNTQ